MIAETYNETAATEHEPLELILGSIRAIQKLVKRANLDRQINYPSLHACQNSRNMYKMARNWSSKWEDTSNSSCLLTRKEHGRTCLQQKFLLRKLLHQNTTLYNYCWIWAWPLTLLTNRCCLTSGTHYQCWWSITHKHNAHYMKSVQTRSFLSCPYFPVLGLNTEIYGVNPHIQSEYRKTRTRKNPVVGHFSRSYSVQN